MSLVNHASLRILTVLYVSVAWRFVLIPKMARREEEDGSAVGEGIL